jgi:hypothetical protein
MFIVSVDKGRDETASAITTCKQTTIAIFNSTDADLAPISRSILTTFFVHSHFLVYLSDSFPDEYPKLTLSAPLLPSSSYLPTPEPEVIHIKLYSPRWGAERIVQEIWEQLWDEIPRFYSKACHLASAPSSHPL